MARGRSQAEDNKPEDNEDEKSVGSAGEAGKASQQVGARVKPEGDGDTGIGGSAAGTESPAGKEQAKDSDPDNKDAEEVAPSKLMPAQYEGVKDEDILPAQSRD